MSNDAIPRTLNSSASQDFRYVLAHLHKLLTRCKNLGDMLRERVSSLEIDHHGSDGVNRELQAMDSRQQQQFPPNRLDFNSSFRADSESCTGSAINQPLGQSPTSVPVASDESSLEPGTSQESLREGQRQTLQPQQAFASPTWAQGEPLQQRAPSSNANLLQEFFGRFEGFNDQAFAALNLDIPAESNWF